MRNEAQRNKQHTRRRHSKIGQRPIKHITSTTNASTFFRKHNKMASTNNEGGGGGNQPWAWLGLLKWSLSYSDGTRDNSDISPMTAEDRAFLEKVMKEGVIDENERMKFILQEAAKAMEYYKSLCDENREKSNGEDEPPIAIEALEVLLQE
jgi:hypothetical protein